MTKILGHLIPQMSTEFPGIESSPLKNPATSLDYFLKGSNDHGISQTITQPMASIKRRLTGEQRIHLMQPSNNETPGRVSKAMADYTLQNKGYVNPTVSIFKDAKKMSDLPDLQSVFQNNTLKNIFLNHQSYKSLQDLLNNIYRNKNRLISSLSFGQKLKYGMRVKNLFSDLERLVPFLDQLLLVYSRHLNLSLSESISHLASYFFRRDLLPQENIQIFHDYLSQIDTTTKGQPWWVFK